MCLQWCCLNCCCNCCLLLSGLGSMVLFRLASIGCDLKLTGIHPASGGTAERLWAMIHWIGFRNVLQILPLVPGYSETKVAAGPSDGSKQRCAFTFDDGIGSDSAGWEALLGLLSDESVPATFFIIASEKTMRVGGEVLRNMSDLGHEIGNHGLSGGVMTSMGREEVSDAVGQWETRIRSVIPRWPGPGLKWFRPPKGLMSPAMADVTIERHYSVALGDIYTEDWRIHDRDFHTNVIANGASDGSVVILHVNGENLPRALAIVRESVPRLRARGFEFASLTDLFGAEQGSDQWCSRCVPCGVLFLMGLSCFPCLCCTWLGLWLRARPSSQVYSAREATETE